VANSGPARRANRGRITNAVPELHAARRIAVDFGDHRLLLFFFPFPHPHGGCAFRRSAGTFQGGEKAWTPFGIGISSVLLFCRDFSDS